MGTIAPSTFASGMLGYPKFPEWLGKNSIQKKIERMIRDVREMCAHHLYTNKNSILFESIPMMFEMVYSELIKESVEHVTEAVSILEDFNMTMEGFKDLIVALQLSQKNIDNFTNLKATIKGSFTKIYNSVFKSSVKAAKKKATTMADHFSLKKNFDAGEDCYS